MLKRLKLDSATFNSILKKFYAFVDYEDSIGKYFIKGYKNKKRIKAEKDSHVFICQADIINYVTGKEIIPYNEDWRQIVCVKKNDLQSADEIKELSWNDSFNKRIEKVLHKYYTDAEIEERLNMYQEKNHIKPLISHLPMKYHDGKIHLFKNCVYYDINGAHRDALCEIFPKAKNDFLTVDKQDANSYVGDLCNRGHVTTYNWIVKRTKNMLLNILDAAGGEVIYKNTDGAFIVNGKELPTSSKLGEFKNGMLTDELLAYRFKDGVNTPYVIYQFINKDGKRELKGTTPNEVRNHIDLANGTVVSYKSKKQGICMEYEDVKELQVDIVQENELDIF